MSNLFLLCAQKQNAGKVVLSGSPDLISNVQLLKSTFNNYYSFSKVNMFSISDVSSIETLMETKNTLPYYI